MKATWTAGLVIGVAFLLANNPRKEKPQLTYKPLYGLLVYPLLFSVSFAVAIGVIFNLFALKFSSPSDELLNPQSYKYFLTTWGIHIGSYAGGLAEMIVGIVRTNILRKRIRLSDTNA